VTLLQVRLLGSFQIQREGNAVTAICQPRQQVLLAYLILRCHTPQPRRQIAYTLWPDSSDEQASTNLRRELHHLRQALPPCDQLLTSEARTLGWRGGLGCDVDVAMFEEHLAQAWRAAQVGRPREERDHLELAMRAYGGDLFPDCYDDWIQEDRERLRQGFQHALERLARLCEDARDYAAAISYAERLVLADRFCESCYRQLMHLHLLNDDRPSALRIYHTCSAMLQQELGVGPSPATEALYTRIVRVEQVQLRSAEAGRPVARSLLVGRSEEWQVLRSAWAAGSAGTAQLVCIAGEPGIGKSRLLEEMIGWVEGQGYAAAYARAYAAEGSLAYDPVAEWLRAASLRPRLETLNDTWLVETARLLPELLANRPDLPHPPPLSEGWQRRRFFEALARAFLAVPEPLLLVLDDLQWCDRETIEWLHYLLRHDPGARLLVIGAFRPGEVDAEHPLTGLLHALRPSGILVERELAPLDERETGEVARQVAGRALAPGEMAALHRATEGNPLFVGEMVRSGLTAAPADGHTPLPPRVQSVIAARLGRLSPQARALAEVAATVGRSFSFDILLHASATDEDAIVASLDELWQRRIVRVQGQAGPGSLARYDFSHDKIRETACAGVSPARGPLLHRKVAEALESVHAANLDPVCAEIAAHYEYGGMFEQAVGYYQRATKVAQDLCVHQDALRYVTRARELLSKMAPTPDQMRRELGLLIASGISLIPLLGMPAAVREHWARAYELAEQVGDVPERLATYAAWLAAVLLQGDPRTAHEMAQREYALATTTGDRRFVVDAHFDLGLTLEHLGRWRECHPHYAAMLVLRDDEWAREVTPDPAQDGPLLCRRHLAMSLWHLGYPGQALVRADEAMSIAQRMGYPFSVSSALVWAARLHRLRGEPEIVRSRTEHAIAVCVQHGFAYRHAFANVLLGWAMAQDAEAEAGLALIEEGLTMFRELKGGVLHQPECRCLAAEAYLHAGRPDEGLAHLDEGLALSDSTRIADALPELHRLRGELLRVQQAEPQQVEACFLRALNIAREQGTRSFELRAATSLAQLWRDEGRCAEARALLADLYAQFTEGFDTGDLRAARALLAEL
jgi:DNA-binding SARP family transcriptional activator